MVQGGELINIGITREIRSDEGSDVEFDTVIEIGEQRHVIKNTDPVALENCPETFYCEKLDQILSIGWRMNPIDYLRMHAGEYLNRSNELKCKKGEYFLSLKGFSTDCYNTVNYSDKLMRHY